MLTITPKSDTTPTGSFVTRALSITDVPVENTCIKEEGSATTSHKKKTEDCLSTVVGRYLAAYLKEHQDHLPVGQLYALVMGEVEKVLLKETLTLTDGNQKKASEILGINRNTLRKKNGG
jgi:DNA-binding protein Fis